MSIKRLHLQLDSIISYLSPLLPLANCSMVEFLSHNHWDSLLPVNLKNYLDRLDLHDAINKFWNAVDGEIEENPLNLWVLNAKSNYIKVNGDYCLSLEQLKEKIHSMGGDIQEDIMINEFMNKKKSYEVQMMSSVVASLVSATGSTCCVEAGGGKGHLLVALSLGYCIPSLTVDCNDMVVSNAAKRVKILQKQWHVIAKKLSANSQQAITKNTNSDLHKFATAYITRQTDLAAIVKEHFLQITKEDLRIFLTGLHTCGDLGPSSLRIVSARDTSPYVNAALTVPCCYHLLTEAVNTQPLSQPMEYTPLKSDIEEAGFPMSNGLRGLNLGRNARMLAAQSADRVGRLRQWPAQSLLFRALYEVLVKELKPGTSIPEGKLKKMSGKCKDFRHYVQLADAILGWDLSQMLTDQHWADIEKNQDIQWKKIVLFYLIRMCLAQVVESVILLDRLLFLYESGIEKSCLVKLFDPVLSPRCYCIIAIR